jgi:quercetin dioxygenase-like cupin family protein
VSWLRIVSAFDDLASLPPLALFEGIVGRAVHGELITLGVLELDPGALVAEHSHENEQLGICLSGSILLRVRDEERTHRPGGTWRIEANAPHMAQAGPEGAVVIDVFSPPRDDWAAVGPRA